MTLVIAYVPRPEGQAALDQGIEISKRRNERLIVVNAISTICQPHCARSQSRNACTSGAWARDSG